MNFRISYTNTDKQSPYPMHRHKTHEIIYYLSGNGVFRTENESINVSQNNIVVVPPDTGHTLSSPRNCKYIAIAGNFEHNLYFASPVLINDNSKKDGEKLIDMIYRNCVCEDEYLLSLINSYVHFIMQNVHFNKNIDSVVSKIMHNISSNFFECDINIKTILDSSGYAQDYIRSVFKQSTGMTPNEYLSKVRMNHACYLIDVYSNTMSMTEIALRCGYYDYTYFSQKFKKTYGISPRDYKKQIT